MILVRGLVKRFGAVVAVDDVSFAVAPGEVFGLLGPNGAGKTTTVECLLGLMRADAGMLEIGGAPAGSRAARAATGAVLQATGLPDAITPAEAVDLFAALADVEAEPGLLERFGLGEKKHAAYATLSGGQKQRLALALAFVGAPRALVLDEPTTGLDVAARNALHADIRAARASGLAVLLTSHDMAEAAALCDRVAVMKRGRIVALGPPAELGPLEALMLDGAA